MEGKFCYSEEYLHWKRAVSLLISMSTFEEKHSTLGSILHINGLILLRQGLVTNCLVGNSEAGSLVCTVFAGNSVDGVSLPFLHGCSIGKQHSYSPTAFLPVEVLSSCSCFARGTRGLVCPWIVPLLTPTSQIQRQ